MAYTWRVYKAMWDEEPLGYVYAHNEAEARQVWTKLEGPAINAMVEVDDVEFYMSSEAEGGYVLFLSPDELVDFFIEKADVNTPHVFYMHGEDE